MSTPEDTNAETVEAEAQEIDVSDTENVAAGDLIVVAKDEGLPVAAPVLSESAQMLAIIERASTNPDVDLAKMQQLIDMRNSMDDRAAAMEFTRSMALAQAEMEPVRADATNPQTKSKYAKLAALDRAIRPIYTKHGFSLSFDSDPEAKENEVHILCYVTHREGHSKTYNVVMPADGKGAKGGDVMTKTHATGSGFAYGQRYLTKMIFNIAVSTDDDGNLAGIEKITAQQADTLRLMLSESDGNEQRFLSHVGVPNIHQIPAARFKEMSEMIDSAWAKKKARADKSETVGEADGG